MNTSYLFQASQVGQMDFIKIWAVTTSTLQALESPISASDSANQVIHIVTKQLFRFIFLLLSSLSLKCQKAFLTSRYLQPPRDDKWNRRARSAKKMDSIFGPPSVHVCCDHSWCYIVQGPWRLIYIPQNSPPRPGWGRKRRERREKVEWKGGSEIVWEAVD